MPLGEAYEAYEIDILASPSGPLKRTLTSTSPSVVYTNAQIMADFGSMPASLSLAVCQMSAMARRLQKICTGKSSTLMSGGGWGRLSSSVLECGKGGKVRAHAEQRSDAPRKSLHGRKYSKHTA